MERLGCAYADLKLSLSSQDDHCRPQMRYETFQPSSGRVALSMIPYEMRGKVLETALGHRIDDLTRHIFTAVSALVFEADGRKRPLGRVHNREHAP